MLPMLIVEEVFEKSELNKMIDSIAESLFQSAPNNVQFESLQLEKTHITYKKFDNLTNVINALLNRYYNKNIKFHTGKSVARYTEGKFIGKHRDWEPNDPYVIENNKPRIDLGSVFYLNDDYIGGEINFYSKFDSNVPYMSIKPKSNTCIFFDSSIYHMTNPIIKGTKYSYTTFYQLED